MTNLIHKGVQTVVSPFFKAANQAKHRRPSWSYLLSNSLAFNQDCRAGIRIKKPSDELLPNWIERLICSGQCHEIYVHDLNLEHEPGHHLKQLCKKYAVAIFNVTVVKDYA